jgi:Mg-chelatase subunit ChlD
MAQATDRDLAALARRLAGRITTDLAKSGPAPGRGVGRLRRHQADDTSDEIDIDGSLDSLLDAAMQRRPPRIDELMANRWQRPTTAICLLVDRSGSMDGARLASAALAAAACAWRAPADFAVFAFNDRAIEIKPIDRCRPTAEVVADLLALKGHGTTDVALALGAAKAQLRRSRASRRLTVLLSDAETTAGSDPVPHARALDELAIIAPADERSHADRLASAAGARVVEVGQPLSVLAALQQVLR